MSLKVLFTAIRHLSCQGPYALATQVGKKSKGKASPNYHHNESVDSKYFKLPRHLHLLAQMAQAQVQAQKKSSEPALRKGAPHGQTAV